MTPHMIKLVIAP